MRFCWWREKKPSLAWTKSHTAQRYGCHMKRCPRWQTILIMQYNQSNPQFTLFISSDSYVPLQQNSTHKRISGNPQRSVLSWGITSNWNKIHLQPKSIRFPILKVFSAAQMQSWRIKQLPMKAEISKQNTPSQQIPICLWTGSSMTIHYSAGKKVKVTGKEKTLFYSEH